MKGLIKFGTGLRKPGSTSGSGAALEKINKAKGTAMAESKKPENAFAALHSRFEQRNALQAILYGLDYTASTNDVVEQFRKIADKISRALGEEFGNPEQYFGIFNGHGIDIGENGDASALDSYNERGNSDVPRFINSALEEQLKGKNNSIAFIFGDELDWDCSCIYGGDEKLLNSAIQGLREKQTPLFFIYTNTKHGNNTREEIEEGLIKPLGEKGFLLDMSEVDVNQLLDIIRGCVSYSVSSRVGNATGKRKQISLEEHLKKLGASGLKITQGEEPKQLGYSN